MNALPHRATRAKCTADATAIGVTASPLRTVAQATAVAIAACVAAAVPLATLVMPDQVSDAMKLGALLALVVTPPLSLLLLRQAELSHQARIRARALAERDSVTGAYTRQRFMTLAEVELSKAGAQRQDLCVVRIEIDDMGSLSTRYGPTFGDQVLRLISDICLSQLRTHDLFARYGDKEFVALLPATHPDIAARVIERLKPSISAVQLTGADGVLVPVSASFGVARLDYEADTLDRVLDKAYAAIASARQTNGNAPDAAIAGEATRRTAPA